MPVRYRSSQLYRSSWPALCRPFLFLLAPREARAAKRRAAEARLGGTDTRSLARHSSASARFAHAHLRMTGRGPSLSDSNCQTAKHHRPRVRLSRASSVLFSFASRSVFVRSLKEREQSAVGRTRDAVPLDEARRRPCEAGSPYGAPLRRFKSLVPHFPCPALAGERLRDIDPGPRIGPGGFPPRTPGTAVCETAGAGAAPHPRSDFARPSAPLWMGMRSTLAERQISSTDKNFFNRGSHGANRAGSRGRGLVRIVGSEICAAPRTERACRAKARQARR